MNVNEQEADLQRDALPSGGSMCNARLNFCQRPEWTHFGPYGIPPTHWRDYFISQCETKREVAGCTHVAEPGYSDQRHKPQYQMCNI